MNKIILAIIISIFSLPAFGQTAALTDFCKTGATQATVSGLPSTNYQQGIIPSCEVRVYNTGTTNLATIYANASSGTLTNPFKATTTGQWTFWAGTTGCYDIVMSGGIPPNAFKSPVTLTGVCAGGGGGGGGSSFQPPNFAIQFCIPGSPCIPGGSNATVTAAGDINIPKTLTTSVNSGTTTATGNSTISAALALATFSGTNCSTNCVSEVDPAFTSSTPVPALPYSKMFISDLRNGVIARNFQNWNSLKSYLSLQNGAENNTYFDTSVPDFTSPITTPNSMEYFRYGRVGYLYSTTPGLNQIASDLGGASGVQTSILQADTSYVYGQGIKQTNSSVMNCYGAGDCGGHFIYVNAIPARIAPSDQGVNPIFVQSSEASNTAIGIISSSQSINPGSTWLRVNFGGTNGLQGVGRYLLGETPLASGSTVFATSITNGSGFSPGIITLPSNTLPVTAVSTAWGITTSACLPNLTASNTGGQCQFTISVTSGVFLPNYLEAATGTNHNQFTCSVVNTVGSVATVTCNVDHQIPTGAYIYQGNPIGNLSLSCTGSGLVLKANISSNNGTSLKYPIDVVGCTDRATVDVVMYAPSGGSGVAGDINPANVFIGTSGITTPLSSSGGGIITTTLNSAIDGVRFTGQTVDIVGSATSGFLGPCTAASYNSNTGIFSCTHAGAPTHTDSTTSGVLISLCDSATVCNGSGNSNLSIYPIAEVLDVSDPSIFSCPENAPLCNVNGYLVVEANQIPSTIGYSVEESHHYSQEWFGTQTKTTKYDTYDDPGTFAQIHNIYGVYGSGQFVGSSMASYTNETPASNYFGFGGTRYAPNGFVLQGVVRNAITMQYPPQIGNSVIEINGCPDTNLGCADPNYNYYLYGMAGNTASASALYIPSSSTLNFFDGNSLFQMTPTGFSFNQPLAMEGNKITGLANPLSGTDACNLQTCSGSGTVSGQANGIIPLATASSAIGAQSHMDDGVTTAGTITSTEPMAINASSLPSQVALTYDGHALAPGSGTTSVYGVDSSGNSSLSESGGTAARICTASNSVCAGGFTNPMTTLGDTLYQGPSVATRLAGPSTNGHTFFLGAQPSGSAVAPAWIDFASPPVIGLGTPNQIFGTVISATSSFQTSALGTATSSANFNSANFETVSSFWNGSSAAANVWEWLDILGTGTNPTSTLTFTKAGTTGFGAVSVPSLIVSGISSSTSPVCPNGTNGSLTTAGCSGASGVTNISITVTGGTQGANSCTSAATATMTGLTTGMVVLPGYGASPAALTGWGSSGGMVFDAWASASNTVSWIACNQTTGSITYSGITFIVGAK